jgi:hypothetical protein
LLLGALDERHHVAHAEDPAGERSGWKTSSASVFSPVPMNLTASPVTALIERAAPPGRRRRSS